MANRLQAESSPYLLQHAENPVDWFPWGKEAFEQARLLDKPVFLSIGYAACHWCHVMAHESFEDPQTAQLMNEGFINIKVDREERPDVDSVYMDAVMAITGHGGWPLSVFLTPEGKPFYGGTYFPPDRRYNMPSFQEVLGYISHLWDEDRERIAESSKELTQGLNRRAKGAADPLDPAGLAKAVHKLFDQYDWKNGGWGNAPKFPSSTTIETLLLHSHRRKDQLALDMASHALAHMRRGGIYDQIGGGFHRYAVDAGWLVPHFEKMLYDNALLLRTYLHHWQISGDPASFEVINSTIDFLVREMRDARGGFYSSLDADSEGEEGAFYLWSFDEFRQVCSQSKYPAFAIQALGVTEQGNFEGRNVLYQPHPLVNLASQFEMEEEEARELLQELRSCLLEIRSKRLRPAADDKVIASWNGLLLIALAEAARAQLRGDVLQLAQDLASFLLEQLTSDQKLYRSWRNGVARFTAYLEDHAAIGLGLLSLYQTDFNTKWLRAARWHAREILGHFIDEAGGFYDTRDDHEPLITRPKTLQDTPIPSGSALAASLLLQLAALDGEHPWAEPAIKALSTMQALAGQHPNAFSGWLNALDFALGPQIQLAISGDPSGTHFMKLFGVVRHGYLPRMVCAGGHPDSGDAPELLQSRPREQAGATAYLCQDFHCQLPTDSPEGLKAQLDEALSHRRQEER